MNMSVNIAGVEWKNPVTVASGTFGSGAEYSEFTDLNKLGAVTTKGVANVPWAGNPTPRVAEVYGGMLNAVGLQNPGIDLFCQRDIPFLKKYDTRIVVNVCGHSTEEYVAVVERLADEPVDMLEINISCPNVKEGGIAFGQDPRAVEAITKEMKKHAKQPGMSGPAIHPVAVRMVYQTYHAVNVPIIGMGGIMNANDAIEMILAGATAVSVGTANFTDPRTAEKVVAGIEEYMKRYNVADIKDLVGAVHE